MFGESVVFNSCGAGVSEQREEYFDLHKYWHDICYYSLAAGLEENSDLGITGSIPTGISIPSISSEQRQSNLLSRMWTGFQ